MDERVYAVVVCGACFTQLGTDGDGNSENCYHCGKYEPKEIRFRVARAAVLKQADPHQSLVERTLYFGCVRQTAGHDYYRRGSDGHPYRDRALHRVNTPWGYSVDGGLSISGAAPEGQAHVFHKDNWTALAFNDRSVDTRGNSVSVYCIPAVLDGPEALLIARAAFPPIFARYTFPVVLAT